MSEQLVILLHGVGACGQVGQKVAGPDLAVRMRIGAAHHCAFVFKNLHPTVLLPQFGALLLPYLY